MDNWLDYSGYDFSDSGDYGITDAYSSFDWLGGDSGLYSASDGFDPYSNAYSDNSWIGTAGDMLGGAVDFLTTDSGMGLLAGLGAAGLGYLQQEQQKEAYLEAQRERLEHDTQTIANHNAGISALAAKYPPNPNFKRTI